MILQFMELLELLPASSISVGSSLVNTKNNEKKKKEKEDTAKVYSTEEYLDHKLQ